MIKKAYIGKSGSGKTHKLLSDLKDIKTRDIFNKESTLVVILKDEEESFKRALPKATFCIDDEEIPTGDFDAIVVDTIYMDSKRVEKLAKPNGHLPENVLWTFQSAKDMAVFFDEATADTFKSVLSKIDEDLSVANECVVFEDKRGIKS